MNRLATFLLVAWFTTLASAQGILFDCFHLVRLDYLLEEERAITFARPVDISLPKYDFELVRAGMQGTAVVSFKIDQSGLTRDVVLVQETLKEFGQAATDAVSKWKFKPAKKEGASVSGKMECKFSFVLEQ